MKMNENNNPETEEQLTDVNEQTVEEPVENNKEAGAEEEAP